MIYLLLTFRTGNYGTRISEHTQNHILFMGMLLKLCFSETLDKNSLFSLLMLEFLLRESLLVQVGIIFLVCLFCFLPPHIILFSLWLWILVESRKHIFRKAVYIFCWIKVMTKRVSIIILILLVSQKIQVISVHIFLILFVYICLFYLSNRSIWMLSPKIQ